MTPQATSITSPSVELQADDLKPYVIKFTIVYAISSVAIGLIAWLLDSMFNVDVPATVAGVTTTLAGVMAACHAFVKTHGRLFSQSERKYMTWASFIMSWLVSLLMSMIFILGLSVFFGDEVFDVLVATFYPLATGSYLAMFLLLMTLLACIGWFMTYWMYGSFAKSALKTFEKPKSKT